MGAINRIELLFMSKTSVGLLLLLPSYDPDVSKVCPE
jgi:hypothetical protein